MIKRSVCQEDIKFKNIYGMRQAGGSDGKESTCCMRDLSWEDPLEEGMATHSNILAWRIPWTEESGGLQPMGLQRVGHN